MDPDDAHLVLVLSEGKSVRDVEVVRSGLEGEGTGTTTPFGHLFWWVKKNGRRKKIVTFCTWCRPEPGSTVTWFWHQVSCCLLWRYYDLPCTWWSLSYSSRRWRRKCSHRLWRPHLLVCNSAFRQIPAQTWAEDIWFNLWLKLIIPCAKGNQRFLVIATIWAKLEHLWTARWKESVCKNYLTITWWRATSVTQTLFCLSTVIMWGRKNCPWPQELMMWPLEFTVRIVACGIGIFLSRPYVLSLKRYVSLIGNTSWAKSLTSWMSGQSKFDRPCERSLRCHTCRWTPRRAVQVPSPFPPWASWGPRWGRNQEVPFVAGLHVGLWRKHDGEFSLAKNRKERVACRLKRGGLKNQTSKIILHRAACIWKGM